MLQKITACVIDELLPAGIWALESNKELFERTHKELKQCLEVQMKLSHNKTIMVVTHSGVIHALLSELDESGEQFSHKVHIPTCSLHLINF
jgi:broad specificity phosphatase PhoE